MWTGVDSGSRNVETKFGKAERATYTPKQSPWKVRVCDGAMEWFKV